MKLGSNDIGSVYIGSTAVTKIYIGSTEVWTSNSGLLADYPGAAAAYSLRLLQTTYTGDAIRVRRASDNAETNIGFVSGQLDTTTLETFCSGTNGFVTTWYDQSGNGYDATQTTAASQPQIVNIGSTITENGKPAIQFDGSSDGLINTSSDVIASNAANSVLVVAKNITVFNYSNILWAKNAQRIITAVSNFDDFSIFNTNSSVTGARYTFAGIPNLNQYLIEVYWDGTTTTVANSYDVYGNNSLISGTNATGGSPTSFSIGFRNDNSTQYWNGRMSELIIYPSDQSSNRTGIQTNINDFYSIY